jgi:uncharacterized membrane protein
MNITSRLMAVLAYLLPVIGWLIVLVFQRANAFAVYHVRQAVGLALFVIGSLFAWAVIAWVLAWFPLLSVLAVALFALVIAAWLFALLALIVGVINAVSSRKSPLPVLGQWAARLPL